MTLQRRFFTSLPPYFHTNWNTLASAVTEDPLYEPEQAAFVSGYIGDTSKLTTEQLTRTPLLVEGSDFAQKYQFTIGIAQRDPVNGNFVSGAFYDDLLNHITVNGGLVSDPNRLFEADYYVWTPPIDYDKLVNFARYFWTGGGTAKTDGEYITKEAAGTVTTVYQYDGTVLVAFPATIVNGLPGSGSLNEVVEDVSDTNRYLYQWNGSAWGRISFRVERDTTIRSYAAGDWIYITRTGPDFNRPVIWVWRAEVGRWVSIQVVINSLPPSNPVLGMVWEDTRTPPARILRIWDGNQWQLLESGLLDVFDHTPITYTNGAGPSGTPTGVCYLYDTRLLADVDSWSAQNWWRVIDDLTGADSAALGQNIQANRPIIEFWGNIEAASGDSRHVRNQFPLFNLYAVSPVSSPTYLVEPISSGSNFPSLKTTGTTAIGRFWNGSTTALTTSNYVGSNIVSTIFQYSVAATGTPDKTLDFVVVYATDGTPTYSLDMEAMSITYTSGGAVLGYRFFRDTATGYVHSAWEKSATQLTQTVDTNGFYDVPKNLTSNPDHVLTTKISRPSFIDHFTSVIKSQPAFDGTAFGSNSYRFSPKNMTIGGTMIDPEDSLFRIMAVIQTGKIDIPDAIRMMARIYNSVMVRFVNQLNIMWDTGTISAPTDTLTITATQAVDIILSILFQGRNSEFPFFNSDMGTFTETRLNDVGVPYIFDTTLQPIYIPNSPAHIGAAPVFKPGLFTDTDGVSKIRGHDGSLLKAFGDDRDDVILDLENRFYDSVPDYLKNETATFSARYSPSRFHLADSYGNFKPNLTAGTVVDVVSDYTTIVSPIAGDRIYALNQQLYVVWDGTQWLTQNAQTGDVFQNTTTNDYWTFNGFFTEIIPTDNKDFTFDYSMLEYRDIVEREFERFVVSHDLDFVTNTEFDENDFFTYNYSSAGVEGNYRGIYHRVYGTVRPHSQPWEIAGYSIMPDWWLTSYVPTSTASDGTPRYADTHQMWIDFQNGIVNPLSGLIKLSQQMVAPIPVDANGELIDPITSGLVVESALTPASIGDDWQYGDGALVEQRWYDSYFYTWATALAGYLMKPGMFVDRIWSEFYRSIGDTGANQLFRKPAIVYSATLTRPQTALVPNQLSLDGSGNAVKNAGLNSWIAEYSVLIGSNANKLFNDAVLNSQAALGWKTGGFINQARTSFELLSGDEIPTFAQGGATPSSRLPDNFSVVLHQGPSTNEYFQSGVIIVRDTDGFRIFGTDMLNPFFTAELGAKPISGGQIEALENFTYDGNNRTFTTTIITVPPVTNDTATFSILVNGFSIKSRFVQRLSSTQFAIDPSLLLKAGDKIVASVITIASNPGTQLGSFTVNGVHITYFQTGTGVYATYPYGHLFETLNDVVNMLVGHGRFLGQQGWVFERLTNGTLRDWLGCAKAFAIWATNLGTSTLGDSKLQKGQVFEFSVMGRQAQFNAPFGMILGIENNRNGSYGVVDANSQPIRGDNLDIVSSGGSITVSSASTEIFGLRIYVSVVQHVVFFASTTTFGDVIYDPALGLAQPALFVSTYRTTNWNGRLEAPGFLVSGGQIAPTPAGQNPTPVGALFPDWEKQVADITRYYDRFNPPDDPVLTAMSRDLFGYAPKEYINELMADDRTQFNFYRGTLKTKGTRQPYFAFVRGTTVGTDHFTVAEDWAWKFTRYGDRRIVTVLFGVNAADFVDTYQVVTFDTISFSKEFTGGSACFTIDQDFTPEELVVLVDGVLQILGIDYTVAAIDSGFEVCMTNPPTSSQTIDMSVNSTLAQVNQNVFFNASTNAHTIDTGIPDLLFENVILSAGGLFRVSPTAYSVTGGIIDYTPITGTMTAFAMTFTNTSTPMFNHTHSVGNGFRVTFPTTQVSQDINSLIVAVNGAWMTPNVDYTLVTISSHTYVHFTTPPTLNSAIFFFEVINQDQVVSYTYHTTGNASTRQFNIPSVTIPGFAHVLVAVNGLVQVGQIPGQSIPYTYAVENGGILFNTAPASGATINIFVVIDAVSDVILEVLDNRIIQVPQFSPPNSDTRWLIPPPEDRYKDKPYRFPTNSNGTVNLQKYVYTAFLVDQNAVAPATNMFHWDPAAGIHEPLALTKIDYISPYDPARYNNGPLAGTDKNLIWNANQVGQVWWDTTKADYSDYKSFLPNVMQASREWGRLHYFYCQITRDQSRVTVTTLDTHTREPVAHNLSTDAVIVIEGADQTAYNGIWTITVASSTTFTFTIASAADTPATGDIMVRIGTINCFEWVASPVVPTAWDAFVDTQTGFHQYTGNVLNGDTASWSAESIWDPNGNKITTYYFWVEKNTRTIPGKDISVNDIAGRLFRPAQYEVPFFGIISPSTMFVFIGADTVADDYAVEVSYEWQEMPRHIEWLLVSEGSDFVLVPSLVTDKLVDSLLGVDSFGSLVPNVTLAPVDRYGTLNFPAQTVFQSKTDALNTYVVSLNDIFENIDLITQPDISNLLLLADETGTSISGFWTRTTFWEPTVDHTVIYDTVDTITELNYRAGKNLYAKGDIVKVLISDQTDPWTGDPVLAYYVYDGAAFSIAGIDRHTAAININVISDEDRFRTFFATVNIALDLLTANGLIFELLKEMVRQNPMIDWFFKTSYIDPHITLPLPTSNFVEPDQAGLIFDAILDLKPYRTKLREPITTYLAEDAMTIDIGEARLTKATLFFDRLACDLNDENAWDTIPWDATASYPETSGLVVTFIGDGIQTCFTLPIAPSADDVVVFINDAIVIPNADYHLDHVNGEICFTLPPPGASIVSVYLDNTFSYFLEYSYRFPGDGATVDAVLPDNISETTIDNVFSVWNGVHQVAGTDFSLEVTSTTDVVYSMAAPTDVEVSGFVLGNVIDNIFTVLTAIGDGVTATYDTNTANVTKTSIIVNIDGVLQSFGLDFTLDSLNPSNIKVVFDTAVASGAVVQLYVAADPNNIAGNTYIFMGNGSTSFYAIPGLDSTTPVKIIVNMQGLEQLENVDYSITLTVPTGVQFITPPDNGVVVNIYVIWAGVGHRLTPIAAPETIQWDWAFWNYADLGRKEYDLVGVCVGDGVTESYTIGIQQTTTILYNTKLQIYSNGVLSSAATLGLTVTTTQLPTSVIVSFSGAMPTNAYAALYIARGMYEGLEPTFGYQDPTTSVVFAPSPASYQHYFARLISPSYDPSTQMSGCPTPEERIQTVADDMYTIVVKTFVEQFQAPPFLLLMGVEASTAIGSFTFLDTSSYTLHGQHATAGTGTFLVGLTQRVFMTGRESTALAGNIIPTLSFSPTVVASAAIGSFGFHITSSDNLPGVEAHTGFGTFFQEIGFVGGAEASAHVGSVTKEIDLPLAGVAAQTQFGGISLNELVALHGVAVISHVGGLTKSVSVPLPGRQVTAQIGQFSYRHSFGQAGVSQVGSFSPSVTKGMTGVSGISIAGQPFIEPKLEMPSGVAATSDVGAFSFDIQFGS